LRDALTLGSAQSSRATELPAANSLALLRQVHGQPAGALGILAKVYGAFTEGFENIDLRLYRRLLAAN
jgi:hypothetical protein